LRFVAQQAEQTLVGRKQCARASLVRDVAQRREFFVESVDRPLHTVAFDRAMRTRWGT